MTKQEVSPEKSKTMAIKHSKRYDMLRYVPLSTTITPAAAIAHAVRAGTMPSQPNEKTAIMTIVCWPPIHGCLKESLEVRLDFVPIHIVQGIGVGLLDLKVRVARECHSTSEGTLPNIDCQKLGGLLLHFSMSNERATMGDRCWSKGVTCAEKGAEGKQVEQHVVDISNDEIDKIDPILGG
jgi:hypothetical protein